MADVVIMGGGPAGLATAILLAQKGLDTVVLDRDGAPPEHQESVAGDSDNVACGHVVHPDPEFGPDLEFRLGLEFGLGLDA